MLKYLVVPLACDAVSFCHYTAKLDNSQTISKDILKDSIVWAMKGDLSIQFLYPKRVLPKEIIELTETVDHVKIVPSDIDNHALLAKADIVVFNSWQEMNDFEFSLNQSYVFRTSFEDLLINECRLIKALTICNRINVVFTDIDIRYDEYENFLQGLVPSIIEEYRDGHQVQLNILTDRLMLDEMNNCNAGWESLTLAPDGKFYVCPAFWIDGSTSVGNLQKGLDLKNPQLFQLSHAPICRQCDAWQCKRCIWLNKRLTREVNIPGHEQCLASHIERKTSRYLLEEFRRIGPSFMQETLIPEISYLDPFEIIINKR